MILGEKSAKIKKQELKILDAEKVFEDVGKKFICQFGHRHVIGTKCFCKNKYGVFGIYFKTELQKMGYKVFYDTDITQEMQEAFLEKQKQK